MQNHVIDDSWDNDWRFPAGGIQHQAGGIQHQVFRKGEGPGVVLMHELPGMSKECIRLAEEIVEGGFRVYLPLFFGAPNRVQMGRNLVRICIRREFHLFCQNASGPITTWLRALCDEAHRQCGGPGVGAIGMCLTGGFALALRVEPSHVEAPVLSQPSIPFVLPWARDAVRDHGVAPEAYRDTRAWAAEQKAEKPGFVIPAFRFAEDRICSRERLDSLRERIGPEYFVPDEGADGLLSTISAEERRAAGIPDDQTHSVLTGYCGDGSDHDPTVKARQQVLAYLRAQLAG